MICFPFNTRWALPEAVQLACILEATAPKVGNVHPAAAFADMRWEHFLVSGLTIRESFREVAGRSVGQVVWDAVTATRAAVGCNTNLGSLLLFAPLAKAAVLESAGGLRERVAIVLGALIDADSRLVYQAIRSAHPGGLGTRKQHDVAGPAPPDLIEAMAAVADIDAVARQYTSGFRDLFEWLVPWLQIELENRCDPLQAILAVQLRWLAHEPDGLIVRKLGMEEARRVQRIAASIVHEQNMPPGRLEEAPAVQQLDAYLRADGHTRNPGTTADLIAAALLILLLEPNQTAISA